MQSKVSQLATLFGGQRQLAAAIGVHESLVSRWDSDRRGGNHGNVPVGYNQRIVEASDRAGVSREAIGMCLEPWACPCCGQAYPVGHMDGAFKGVGVATP